MNFLKRARKLAFSNYGRNSIWSVELNGEIIAKLSDVNVEDMFWFSYKIDFLNKENITSSNPQCWWKDGFKFKNEDFSEYAENAFSNGILVNGRITMRALYIKPKNKFEEFLISVFYLFKTKYIRIVRSTTILNEISHSTSWGNILYDKQGISILMILKKGQLIIDWDNIEYISLTPAIEKNKDEWKDFKGNSLKELKYLQVRIVLKNRHKITEGTHFLLGRWIASILNLKLLLGADDKYLPKEGVITINVKLKTLSCSREDFITFLSEKAKFGLLVSF